MNLDPDRRVSIAFHECFISASVAHSPNKEMTLDVYVSPVTDKTGPFYRPVLDYLAEVCYRQLDSAIVEDEGMMFGSAELTTYQVYEECPGDIEHLCAVARSEGFPIDR